MAFDGKAFGEEVTEIVKGYVERKTADLAARLEAAEKRLERIEATGGGQKMQRAWSSPLVPLNSDQ